MARVYRIKIEIVNCFFLYHTKKSNMAIKIKYSLEEPEKTYSSFRKLEQLGNYNEIVFLDCSDNELTSLPDTLPHSLQELNCSDNKFTSLPDLPHSLITLNCSYNKLTSLPDLPNSLQKLRCNYNELTSLPDTLPNSLQELYCSNNQLILLPDHLPNSLQKLRCNYNELTSLPDHLPHALYELDCSDNRLTSLPDLPHPLQKLYCWGNKLTFLPDHLPNSLQELYCSDNLLTSLPDHLPNSLEILYCNRNQLTLLPDTLPNSLQYLYCLHNELTLLPKHLPNSLKLLDCYKNKLTSLPDQLPNLLEELDCSDNELTTLPHSIIQCRNLRSINYDDNEIEYIPPFITRFLNRLRNTSNHVDIYNDGQNVHNHQIQESIRNSIYAIMQQEPSLFTDEIINEIISSTILTKHTKQLIMEYCGDNSIHSVLDITFSELLTNVWEVIRSNSDKDEILKVLNDEINDANCKCFTGRISRLINCLNGYDDRVKITIADNSQIGNIIALVKKNLEDNSEYTIDKHKELVRKGLEEREYPIETIEEWLEYIE